MTKQTIYLTLAPAKQVFNPRLNRPEARDFSVEKMTKSPPSNLARGRLSVAVTVSLDPALFNEHLIQASLEIGAEHVVIPTAAVEVAEAPTDGS